MMKSNNRMSRGAAGFTLLEVLVAVVVLSVGLLGLASLQVNGLRFNHSAYMRTQATLLAEEIADRMRANQPAFRAGNYHGTDLAVSEVSACETSAGCTVAQMAQNDLARWQQSVAALLPGGQGLVCLTDIPVVAGTPTAPNCNAGGVAYAINVWWDDNRSGVPNQNFVVTLAPN